MRRLDISDPSFTYDRDDPEGFRAGMLRLGSEVGAEQTGASLYEVPPGQAVCPYHYEYGEEEWVMVIEGRVAVRAPEGTEELGRGELAFFPKGPAGAHQILNETDQPARVLMWSNVVHPTATAYPDSGKVGLWAGVAGEDLVVLRSSGVGYFEGETGRRPAT